MNIPNSQKTCGLEFAEPYEYLITIKSSIANLETFREIVTQLNLHNYCATPFHDLVFKALKDIQQALLNDRISDKEMEPQTESDLHLIVNTAYELGLMLQTDKLYQESLLLLNHSLFICLRFFGENLEASRILEAMANSYEAMGDHRSYLSIIEWSFQMRLKQKNLQCKDVTDIPGLANQHAETFFQDGRNDKGLQMVHISLAVQNLMVKLHCPRNFDFGEDATSLLLQTSFILKRNGLLNLALQVILDGIKLRLNSQNYQNLKEYVTHETHRKEMLRTADLAFIAASYLFKHSSVFGMQYLMIKLFIHKSITSDKPEKIAHNYMHIGEVYARENQHGKALFFNNKALTLTLKHNLFSDNRMVHADLYYYIGTSYFVLGQYNKSISHLCNGQNIYHQLQIHDLDHHILSTILLSINYNQTNEYYSCLQMVKVYFYSPHIPEMEQKHRDYHLTMIALGIRASFKMADFSMGVWCCKEYIKIDIAHFLQFASLSLSYLHSMSLGFYTGLLFAIIAIVPECLDIFRPLRFTSGIFYTRIAYVLTTCALYSNLFSSCYTFIILFPIIKLLLRRTIDIDIKSASSVVQVTWASVFCELHAFFEKVMAIFVSLAFTMMLLNIVSFIIDEPPPS